VVGPGAGRRVLGGDDMFGAGGGGGRQGAEVEGGIEPGALICVADFWFNKERYYPVSATDAAMERRARAAVRRLDEKRDKALAEIRPGVLLEHQERVPMAFEPVSPPEPVDAGVVPDLPEADILPLWSKVPKRKTFADDYELADHCIAHPSEMSAQQRTILVRLFNQPSALEAFEMKGGAVDDLRNLLTATAQEQPENSSSLGDVT